MKTVDSKVTIIRVNVNNGDGHIEITVKDSLSANLISVTKMSIKDFAIAVTGQGFIDGKTDVYEGYRTYGMKRVTKTVNFDVYKEVDKHDLRRMETHKALKLIIDDFKIKYTEDNDYWQILDYGLDRRQDGEHHQYTIVKYVNPEAIKNDE